MENKHAAKILLMPVRESTLWSKFLGLSKRAEQTIPPGDVPVVESVEIQLVMDGMVLGALKEVTNPLWCVQIAVVEILAQNGEHVEPGPASERGT